MSHGPLSREEALARTHLHLALAGIGVACLAPAISWLLALRHLHDPPGPWRRGLFGLAVFDTLLIVALALLASGSLGSGTATPPSLPRIGVALDPARRTAVEVVSVIPDGPADRAGVMVGDRILSVDGEPVASNEALAPLIGKTRRGGVRRLALARGADLREVTVEPVEGLRSPPAPRRPLFQPIKGADASDFTQQIRIGLAEIFVVGVLCAFAKRRRASLLGGLGLLPALIVSSAAALATLEGFRRTIGLSLGASLISLIAGTATLLFAALVLRRGIGPVAGAPEAADPKASTLSTVALGVLYGVSSALRLGCVLLLLFPQQMLGAESARNIGPYFAWGPGGIGITFLAVAVLAPIGEELLFRGVLLPWLTTWARPRTALVLSSVVFAVGHLHYGVGAVIIFLYGLVLGWARLRTGNLRASIALHMILNTTVCAASLLRS